MNFFMYIFSLQILITTSGFYLGFIIWGRSPEWPKATSLPKGSPPHPRVKSGANYLDKVDIHRTV